MSIGISMFPQDGDLPEALIRNADIAMYKAKQRGRSNYQFFDPEMNAKSLERMTVETSLRQMIGRGGTDRALSIPDRHPNGRHRRSGSACPLEAPAIRHARARSIHSDCRGVRVDHSYRRMGVAERHEAGEGVAEKGLGTFFRVSVNLSAGHFHRPCILDMISRALKESDLQARFLEIEITESVAMQDVDATFRNLKALTAMGVTIAIDDFGTGYSSLSY